MASDFINAVLKTEEECRQKETEARKQAEEKKLRAKIDSAQILSEAHRQVEKMLADDKAAISESTRIRFEKDRKKMEAECRKISEKAEKNLERVTLLAVEALVQK